MPLMLTIVLQQPPANSSFALQKGTGNNFEAVQVQQAGTGKDLYFELAVDVKGTPSASTTPDFKGAFVQGPKDGRFIYIGIGAYAGVKGEQWDRRLKVPLAGITWPMLNNGALITTVPGTGKEGTPNCATVKPFAGWQPK